MSRKIKDIVRLARGDLSQAHFAAKIGKSQAVLSKYERGLTNPSSKTIEMCLLLLEQSGAEGVVSSDSLAARVRKDLKRPEFAYVRRAITDILDGLEARARGES